MNHFYGRLIHELAATAVTTCQELWEAFYMHPHPISMLQMRKQKLKSPGLVVTLTNDHKQSRTHYHLSTREALHYLLARPTD